LLQITEHSKTKAQKEQKYTTDVIAMPCNAMQLANSNIFLVKKKFGELLNEGT
jgi:hypothetical protein